MLTLTACGGTSSPDAKTPSGSFPVRVTRASFPARQHLSGTADLVLGLTNTGARAIPQLTVTIWTGAGDAAAPKAAGAFDDQPGAASRPVWVPVAGYPKLLGAGVTQRNLDAAPPGGADAAQTNSYTFGALAAGASRTVVWRVAPVRKGSFAIHYAIAAGVGGGADVIAAGRPAGGRFAVTVDGSPPGSCVVSARRPYRGACS